jgi:hypothetical protein
MSLFDPGDPKTLRCHGDAPNPSTRLARASFALALIALAVGVVCIMGGQWGPGLILVFAAVAGVMTAWQMRRRMNSGAQTDDHAA